MNHDNWLLLYLVWFGIPYESKNVLKQQFFISKKNLHIHKKHIYSYKLHSPHQLFKDIINNKINQ